MSRRRAIMEASQGWKTATVDNIPQFNQNVNGNNDSNSRFIFYNNHIYWLYFNFSMTTVIGSIVVNVFRNSGNYRRAVFGASQLSQNGTISIRNLGSSIFSDVSGTSIDGTSCYAKIEIYGAEKQVTNLQLYDLTEIFGAGNEPSKKNFIALFSNTPYPYKTATQNLDGAKKYEYQLLDAQTNTYKYREIK